MDIIFENQIRESGVFHDITIPYFIRDANTLRGLKNALPTLLCFFRISRKRVFFESRFSVNLLHLINI